MHVTKQELIGSSGSNANYLIASTASPYVVFGAPYSTGCAAQMISVDANGTLTAVISNETYDSTAGVHGLALSSDNKFLYSADDMGNAVWIHSINFTCGSIEEVQYLAAPSGADPRHLVVHPLGNYAYVVFEALSEVGVYERDNTTGELTYTDTTFPLLPTGKHSMPCTKKYNTRLINDARIHEHLLVLSGRDPILR